MWIDTMDLVSPIGDLRLALREGRLCGLSFEGRWESLRRYLVRRFGEIRLRSGSEDSIADQLRSYFDGQVDILDELPVDPGGTEFQRLVWDALRTICAGSTLSYQGLAQQLGRPAAARAVATANATNPVAIVIPCHRVIHADGSLSGYGGGVARKRWLLQHEAVRDSFQLRSHGG